MDRQIAGECSLAALRRRSGPPRGSPRFVPSRVCAADARRADIGREAKKREKDVRDLLKRGDKRNARVIAVELVRSRGAVSQLYHSKVQLNSASLQLGEQLGAPAPRT